MRVVSLGLAVLWGTCSLTACSLTPAHEQVPVIKLELRMAARTVNGEVHPVAHVVVTNISDSIPVAFSKTYGTTDGKWLSFRIEDISDGEFISYPMEIDLFEQPKYLCIPPGDFITWEIDLLNWKVVIGGKIDGNQSFGFQLPPGDYRIQAVYRQTGAPRLRCPTIEDSVRSAWQEFSVPKRSSRKPR